MMFAAFPLFFILMALLGLFWFGFMVAATVFWILMLIDLLKREFPPKKQNEQIIWVIVLIFTYWLGALLYYFLVKRPDQKQSPKPHPQNK